VQPVEGGLKLRQTATFDPVGLSGLPYWYVLFPVQELVFRGMIRNLGRAAVLVETEKKPYDSPALEIPPKTNSKSVPPTND
jgi:hypothetical protein